MSNTHMALILMLLAFPDPLAARRAITLEEVRIETEADKGSVGTALDSEHDSIATSLNAANITEESSSMMCTNYCVACNDGSTVWYGRANNWWKAASSSVVGGVAIAASATGVGIVGVAAGAVGAGLLGYSAGEKQMKETHTHWTGSMATSGFFCERADIVKYVSKDAVGEAWMSASKSKFGRIEANKLKPYDAGGKPRTSLAYTDGTSSPITYAATDDEHYKEGCKVVKGSGMKGGWAQFKSVFSSDKCKSSTVEGVKTCSLHSKLCGSAGVAGILKSKDVDTCKAQAGTMVWNTAAADTSALMCQF